MCAISDNELDSSLCQLLRQFMTRLLEDYLVNDAPIYKNIAIDQREELSEADTANRCKEELLVLEYFAIIAQMSGAASLPVTAVLRKVDAMVRQENSVGLLRLLKMGLIDFTHSPFEDSFAFIHPLFQEFFAALFLAKCMLKEKCKLFPYEIIHDFDELCNLIGEREFASIDEFVKAKIHSNPQHKGLSALLEEIVHL